MNRVVFGVMVISGMVVLALPAVLPAQEVQKSAGVVSGDVSSQISMFSYEEGPVSKLNFRGTPVAANGEGKGEVEYQDGNARIEVEVDKLPDPTSLGPYTVYVLWALTPDGRALNQGVIDTDKDGEGKIDTSYGASQFALIVTAEPHFAVSIPSTMVALYNVADKVKGTESKVTTLSQRADYSTLPVIPIDKKKAPVELVQARYALAIAAAAGGEQFAPQDYETAKAKLVAAEAAAVDKKRSVRKTSPTLAREATMAGEDARRVGMTAKAAADAEAKRVASANAAATAAVASQQAKDTAAASAAARADLERRLATVLPTEETDRGLVSEIGGVNFVSGTANLNSKAKESLAKFTGIVASYPSLKFKVEGHTDSTGSEETNKELSLKRALVVRDYLIGQGVAASSTDAAGLGSSMPIGDNATNDGRARNRRVEIVVSGTPIDK